MTDGLKFFPLMIDRWLAGTRFMTLEQKGAYLELLLYLYEGRGRVIKDHKHVARILSIHGNLSRKLWGEIRDKFARNQYGYYHHIVGELQRNGGKVKGLSSGAHRGVDMGGVADSTSTSTRTPIVPFEIPPEIDPAAWSDFEQHRREIKKPMTNLARSKAANQLIGLSHDEQRRCVDMTIQNHWQGLFPDKVRGNGVRNSGREDWRKDL